MMDMNRAEQRELSKNAPELVKLVKKTQQYAKSAIKWAIVSLIFAGIAIGLVAYGLLFH